MEQNVIKLKKCLDKEDQARVHSKGINDRDKINQLIKNLQGIEIASVLAEMHLIAVAFLLLGATSLIESSGCPSGGWIPLGDHCYLLSPTIMNWFQAQQVLQSLDYYSPSPNTVQAALCLMLML